MLTPIKAIRAKCLECSNGQYIEVKLCPVTDCALYPYRHGHRPKKQQTETGEDTQKDVSKKDR